MNRANHQTVSPLVVTNPYELVGELDKINKLFELGLRILHLRKPGLDKHQTEQYIQGIRPEFRNRVMIHSHFTLVSKYGLRGIHLSVKQRKSWLMNKIIIPLLRRQSPHLKVSAAVYRIQSLDASANNYEYLLFGPVFKQLGSPGKTFKFDKSELKERVLKCDTEVVALGGVESADLNELHMLGFKNVAVQSYIWKNIEPIKAFESLIIENNKASILLRVAS